MKYDYCDLCVVRDDAKPERCKTCEPPNQVNAPDKYLIEGVKYNMEYIEPGTVIFTRRG